ncbi:MAG: F0F1 ATP synthase subunit A [Syntrophomonadaceae bacterium]|nr:F0F1 ATP synthase subunit A [Syntrophomonadaceae bacterium]
MGENIKKMGQIVDYLAPYPVFQLGPVTITSTVVNTWIVMGVLFVVLFLATRRLEQLPRGKQHVVELVVEFVWGIAEGLMGRIGRQFLYLTGTLFVFILSLNLAWFIPGLRPPTMDLSTTAAFAVTTIFLVQLIHIKKKGIASYISHFTFPNPLLAPLNLVEEFVRPVSLSLRLYGSIFGEKMVVTILFMLLPFFAPVPAMLLGALLSTIQAFVFTLLTTVYLYIHMHGH